MRSLRWVLLALVVVVVVVAATTLASGGDDEDQRADGYLVRAIFDNASFVISGEDVKVGGVIVGRIKEVELDDADNKAAVVLEITDPGFQDFRQDATCKIGLQSLIGEQFIDCDPTQKRGQNVALAPPLTAIANGPHRGQHLLPVTRTSSPVGPDLLANIMRMPQSERLRLIIAELGTGLSGNGAELRNVIDRANPTLQQATRLVEILAAQNGTIADLVKQSDAALAPLAERRGDLAGFIASSGRVAAASAERGDDLERDLERLPAFLRELKPAVARIGRLSDQFGPSIANLSAKAPDVNRAVTGLGPFAAAARPAIKTLGDAADQGRETFPQLDRLARQVRSTTKPLLPASKNLAALTGSFDRTGGVANLLHLLYLYTGALNGKDGTSHYTRTNLYISSCIERSPTVVGQCIAQFDPDATGAPDPDAADSRSVAPSTAPASAELNSLLSKESGR
ncbi:MlaD family protein [Patulibacter sp.]|uniref:MlaD family protein n=1 Tax=Patulibacter sp. TaxID=1912859 RepID=UPI002724ECF3|nr:MlaD family protein [Patulibacter sp.]MDO9409157.1 MlaD family protein [Patulibacter sp.]